MGDIKDIAIKSILELPPVIIEYCTEKGVYRVDKGHLILKDSKEAHEEARFREVFNLFCTLAQTLNLQFDYNGKEISIKLPNHINRIKENINIEGQLSIDDL